MATEKLAIVTDSACDISMDELADWGVKCVNLHVEDAQGNSLVSDNDADSVEAFYDFLATHDELPKTSMPSPLEFGDMYSQLAVEGYTRVLSIHMSEAMSGTCNSARMAAQTASIPVEVIDLKRNTLTQALLVRMAARLRDEGFSCEEIVSVLESVIPNSSIVFALETLDNLVKGGRTGKATGLIANLLDIKPILMVGQDGVVNSVAKARSMKRAINKLVDKAVALTEEIGPLEGYLCHVRNPEALKMLRDALVEKGVAFKELGVRQVGPIIATHVGLGCVGFAYVPAQR